MIATLSLGPEELRIIGHAINWQLNVPYEHSPPPDLSDEEVTALSRIFSDLTSLMARCRSGAESVAIEVGGFSRVEGNHLGLSPTELRLLTGAVASFLGELQGSPTEVEVVTGLPWARTAEVLARLQATAPSGSR
jgi:hypothetical protein